MQKFIIKENIYCFTDELADDLGFMARFKRSKVMQERYAALKSLFTKNSKYKDFAICNEKILMKDYAEILSCRSNDLVSFTESKTVSFDPLICPYFFEGKFSIEGLKNVQDMIVYTYEVYGKQGIFDARKVGAGFAAMQKGFKFPVVDERDAYDLPEGETDFTTYQDSTKVIELGYSEKPFTERIADVLDNYFLINYDNANIKTALCCIPEILYKDDGEFISKTELDVLLENLEKKFKTLPNGKLKYHDFLISVYAVCEEYFEKNRGKYLKK